MCATCRPTDAQTIVALYEAVDRGDLTYIVDQLACQTCRPTNADTVTALYEAVDQADIGFILDRIADDAGWHGAEIRDLNVVSLRSKRPSEIDDFFALLSDWHVRNFDVLKVVGTGSRVIAEVRVDFMLPNGKRVTDDELHAWMFDDDSRVVGFRRYAAADGRFADDADSDASETR